MKLRETIRKIIKEEIITEAYTSKDNIAVLAKGLSIVAIGVSKKNEAEYYKALLGKFRAYLVNETLRLLEDRRKNPEDYNEVYHNALQLLIDNTDKIWK